MFVYGEGGEDFSQELHLHGSHAFLVVEVCCQDVDL